MRWSCPWWAPFGCRGSGQRLTAEHGALVVSRVGHDLAARTVRDYRRAGVRTEIVYQCGLWGRPKLEAIRTISCPSGSQARAASGAARTSRRWSSAW
jgi:hypothetical protein